MAIFRWKTVFQLHTPHCKHDSYDYEWKCEDKFDLNAMCFAYTYAEALKKTYEKWKCVIREWNYGKNSFKNRKMYKCII